LATLYALILVGKLFPEKHAVVWADDNLLILQTKSRHHFLALVHVFRHFVRLQKDIADQFHEIVVAIIGEEILGLNGHQLGDEGKEGHFYVFMQCVFRSFEKLEECLNSAVRGSSVTSACIASSISSILSMSSVSQSCSPSAMTVVPDSP
jgi:hypothetical protein